MQAHNDRVERRAACGTSARTPGCAANGKRAEALAQYLKKGAAIDVILADPHIETWQKKDQTTGFKLVGKVLELEFAGGAREAGSFPSGGKSQPAADSPRRPAAPARSFDDLTDDAPF